MQIQTETLNSGKKESHMYITVDVIWKILRCNAINRIRFLRRLSVLRFLLAKCTAQKQNDHNKYDDEGTNREQDPENQSEIRLCHVTHAGTMILGVSNQHLQHSVK